MAHLKHEHEELKGMFWVLKNERKIKSEEFFQEISKSENILETISPNEISSNFDLTTL